jgi:hypothetical protein
MKKTLPLVLAGALAACNPGPSQEEIAAQRAQRAEADANLQWQHFNEAKTAGRNELALNFADYLARNHPDSPAWKAVQPQAEELRARLEAEAQTRRLREAWAYHSDAGVKTAYIYSKDKQARLVLRRHPEWGDDVYLLTERGKFTCGSPCTVSVQFDDAPAQTYPASIPETGEAAIFVEDFRKFVPALPDATVVRITATLDDGTAVTPEFEVAEYSTATIGGL